MRALPVSALIFLAACQSGTLDLPTPPEQAAGPRLDTYAPHEGFTGTTVTLALVPHAPDDAITVRFGDGPGVRPRRAAAGWEVEVPAGSTSGRLRVSNGIAEAAFDDAFTWLGAGHVHEGRVATRRQVGQATLRSWTSATREGRFSLSSAPQRALQVAEVGIVATTTDVDGLAVEDAAMTLDGELFALVGSTSDCVKDGVATLGLQVRRLAFTDDIGTFGTFVSDRCLPLPANRHVTAVAMNAAATWIAVVTDTATEGWVTVLAVDADDAAERALPQDAIGDVTWDGRSFVALAGGELWRAVPAPGAITWSTVPVPAEVWDEDQEAWSIAGSRNGRIALGTVQGHVAVSDGGLGDDWFVLPGTFTEVDFSNREARIWGLAWSGDEHTLLVTQDILNRVLAVRSDARGWQIAGVARLDAPRQVSASSDGAFTVSTSRGTTVLSETAQVITDYNANALVRAPAFAAPCAPGGPPDLLVPLGSFARLRRVSLDSLQSSECPDLALPGRAHELVGQADGRQFFARLGDGSLARVSLDAPAQVRPQPDVPLADRYQRLRLSDDGRSLVTVRYDEPTDAWFLVVLDTQSTDWAGHAPLEVPLAEDFGNYFLADGQLIVVRPHAIDRWDLAALRQGHAESKSVRVETELGLTTRVPGAVVALTRQLPMGLFVVGDDGTVSATERLPISDAMGLVASADGRQVYVLGDDQAVGQAIVRLEREASTSRWRLLAPVPLSRADGAGDARLLVQGAGGGALVVVDRSSDELIRVE